ncbi:hypothetical protein ACVJGD_006152 [Bradyrhizobium sp. USDA 10063]
MAEAADELSTPLGQETVAKKRRFQAPFTAMQALVVVLGGILVAFAGIALFNDDPLGGEPIAHIALRKTPVAEEKTRGGRPRRRTCREIAAQAGDRREQDGHHHRRLEWGAA